ncbi:glycosyltransferase [Candidatus Pacearchaeota archaeon]|nr:glycosyltransferase [Candidatus Pacearchaeota archaeon]
MIEPQPKIDSNDEGLAFSVIMPVWPDEERPFGLDFIDNIDYSTDLFEVILTRGLCPCKQRNEAARLAKGDVLVFFDNDSSPDPDYFQKLSLHFANSDIAAVGGPNPGVAIDKYIPNLVEAVFTNPMAIGSKISRYKPTGHLRQAGDSDLIFCNFAIRREIYLQLNGLDERLCPNEENEFFERFRQSITDRKLLYDPELIAREPRPDTVWAWLRKMFGYGKGRARQFKIRQSLWSLLHVMFCTILILPVILLLKWGTIALLWLCLPYIGLLLAGSVYAIITRQQASVTLGLPFGILGTHIAYALGLWKGLFESTKNQTAIDTPVKIDHYKPIKR